MPWPKGKTRPPGAGRKKGTPNKSVQSIQEKLDRIGCDPFEGMAIIAVNMLPCGVCRGTLRTKYKLPVGHHASGCKLHEPTPELPGTRLAKQFPPLICTCDGIGERTCESCFGSGFEACSPELRGKMCAELAQYVGAKRKALEVSGEVNVGLVETLRKRFEGIPRTD
jgi:hypothetical protein